MLKTGLTALPDAWDLLVRDGCFSLKLERKLFLALAGMVVLFVLTPFALVPAGHRGVLTTFGKPSNEVFGEGIHFRWPLAQKMHLVGVAIEKGEGEGDAASKDLQTVRTKVVINYHVRPDAAVTVYRDLGNEPGETDYRAGGARGGKGRCCALYGRGIDFQARHCPHRYCRRIAGADGPARAGDR
jgi:hypothetical protein